MFVREERHDLFPRGLSSSLFPIVICLLGSLLAVRAEMGARRSIDLRGNWDFRRDEESTWRRVLVPSTFQSHEGTNFHGVGWYRKIVPAFGVQVNQRVLLHFDAAATEATVFVDGQRVGQHLGGWTPFRCDISDFLRSPRKVSHEILVRLDEKEGHNTQGFLPVIEPHFGGLWQGVKLLIVPDPWIDDLKLLAIGDPETSSLRVEFPVPGHAGSIDRARLRLRSGKTASWRELEPVVVRSNQQLLVDAPFPKARLWSPTEPVLYELEVGLPGPGGDCVRTRVAFRSIEAKGEQFLLNGHPLSIRGVLNWGYSPPDLAPNAGEKQWRQELEFARSHGFNLMKFCLWIPPRRYLEMADEAGVLTWMEYPTWHPMLTGKYLKELRGEFQEFFEYDRNHPSVVLRSLTCETGPSAELSVIRSLYEAAHASIPAALIEDDSSWIGWNRIHDFYDDHPYGNNDTWVKTLEGFRKHIAEHGTKPLVLGEAIAADTWMDRRALLEGLGKARTWWAPLALDNTGEWMDVMRGVNGPGGLGELRADSLRYGLLMRKYQIEAYRREIPFGGYVVSVIRDFPKASMGLIDYRGRPKWTKKEWEWQGGSMLLLETAKDRRSFWSGEKLDANILLSSFDENPIRNGKLECTMEDPGAIGRTPGKQKAIAWIDQAPGTVRTVRTLAFELPETTTPRPVLIRASLKSGGREIRNEWPIWVLPRTPEEAWTNVEIHRSLGPDSRQSLFAGAPEFESVQGQATGRIVVASRFDDALARFLEGGGRVLFLPDGKEASLPLSQHWFLRGAPYTPRDWLGPFTRDLLVELQHFDLASAVVPEVPRLQDVDSLLMLWDTHDTGIVKTHGIVFETRVGQGWLLVSAAKHSGATNAAGQWLLGKLIEHLRSGRLPKHRLPDEVWTYAKARLDGEQTNLTSRTWQFKPDPRNEGLEKGWQQPDLNEGNEWKPIRIGQWWESQGYPDLDGWAWYRLWVDLPETWRGKSIYLSFEGVDDVYEVYVNGKRAGKGGDMGTKKDALSEKKSHEISALVQAGRKALVAVRVNDWHGAGGIFRPVTLGTVPLNPELDFLK